MVTACKEIAGRLGAMQLVDVVSPETAEQLWEWGGGGGGGEGGTVSDSILAERRTPFLTNSS